MVSDSQVQAFMALFKGRTDAWGSVNGKSNKEPVTVEHYRKHLNGEISLGIYPLLDDGTVKFFAIDLDEKNLDKAFSIRQEFLNRQVPAYVAASKGKGFHIYGFLESPAPARETRSLCNDILKKLGYTTEVFPKQDALDEVITLGNYINLPLFGKTRAFISKERRAVPRDTLLGKVVRIDPAVLTKCVSEIQKKVTPVITKKGVRRKKSAEPPCVQEMLKGVSAGSRDVAAFALARHYLDMNYLPEEILGLLQVWDTRNNPPLNDDRLLQSKVQSAERGGYGFGCSSVQDEPLLTNLCVGEENCHWLRQVTATKKKQGLIKDLSFFETDTHLYEEIIQDEKPIFLAYEKNSGNITYTRSVETDSYAVHPVPVLGEGAITFPDGVDEYGSTLELVDEIKTLVSKYVDIKPIPLEFSAWYIIVSWVYDRLTTVSYLRFMGDTGVGKSRCLDVIGKLCYKPLMMAGAVTPAPIYRLVRLYRGTMILEEADFRDTTEKGEVMTILNAGFERNRPVIRCAKDDPDNIQVLPCFGPKVFATRFEFSDVALEARCLTFVLEETDRDDIPPILGEKFQAAATALRRKLLLWRLRNFDSVDPNDVEEIELGYIEPRLKQVGLPFAIPFKNFPEVMDRFRTFLQNYGNDLVRKRSDSYQGRVVQALFAQASLVGKEYVTSRLISDCLLEDFKLEVKPGYVGKLLKSLGIFSSNRRVAGSRARYLNWDADLYRKLLRRYIVEPEEYQDLFEEEPEMEI